jgi:hypothetical protein
MEENCSSILDKPSIKLRLVLSIGVSVVFTVLLLFTIARCEGDCSKYV